MGDDARTERRIARIAAAGVWIVRGLGATWRMRITHDEELRRLRQAGRPVIFSLWHGQLLPLLYQHRGERVAVLISEHSDGEIIARVAESLGYRTVRGSTSRGAARALLELVRVIEEGWDLAITPDGPRGPAKTFAPGAAIVAQRSGAPVIPVAASARMRWNLRSWDRFLIPRPFAAVHIAYGDATHVVASTARDAAGEVDRMQAAMAIAERRADG